MRSSTVTGVGKWFAVLAVVPWTLVMCASSGVERTGAEGAAAPAVPAVAALSAAQTRTNITNLYIEACAKCHGQRGEGGGGGTRTLLTPELFDQEHDRRFFDAIKNGVPEMGMEAYGETLSPEVIWGLVVHIRELQARARREQTGSVPAVDGVYTTKRHAYRIETVVDSGLETPWGIDWLPDGRMLVTNRPGYMLVVRNGQVEGRVEDMPANIEIGQGGLMDVAVHPDYARNGWIYLAVNDPSENRNRAGITKIVRGKLRFDGGRIRWTDQQTIFQCDPRDYTGAGVHFGARIVFDGKGNIFFPIGDRGNQNLAQDLRRPNGKTFRVREDGTIPPDNPFVGRTIEGEKALDAVWSYGHRNPQGLVFDLEGNLWNTEHGPRGGDELNLIQRGANYGWPIVAFSINYNDSPFATPWPKDGQDLAMPVYRWLPSIGACGLAVVKGPMFSRWRGDLLAGGLSGANIDRIRVANGKMVEREEIFHGHGRVRDVKVHRDGSIYVALNGPDKIVRIVEVR
ncbi:MAG: PQQ-dependent sugar dehydrogenase [Fimbriimonadaceae bacterium]